MPQRRTPNTPNCSNARCRHGVRRNSSSNAVPRAVLPPFVYTRTPAPHRRPQTGKRSRHGRGVDPFFSRTWENRAQESPSPRGSGAGGSCWPSVSLPRRRGHSRPLRPALVCTPTPPEGPRAGGRRRRTAAGGIWERRGRRETGARRGREATGSRPAAGDARP